MEAGTNKVVIAMPRNITVPPSPLERKANVKLNCPNNQAGKKFHSYFNGKCSQCGPITSMQDLRISGAIASAPSGSNARHVASVTFNDKALQVN